METNNLTNQNLQIIYDELLKGNAKPAYDLKQEINYTALNLFNKSELNQTDITSLKLILIIANITYNNMDTDILPIDDGFYDLLIEKYRKYTDDDIYPVGAPPVKFKNSTLREEEDNQPLMIKLTEDDIRYKNNMLYPEIIQYHQPRLISFEPRMLQPVVKAEVKKTHNTLHGHPDLVGTFDKCKYVLISQAMEKGVANDTNVRILERDFFQPLLQQGVISPNEEITIIAELKYDGMSVEADVSDHVISARTRGDTGEGKASDITSLLEGYNFGNGIEEVIGMKFEAVISYPNLYEINRLENKNYKNCRTAINGLMSNSFGRKYRDYITLVPISTDRLVEGKPIDRLVELEFLNKYYSTGIQMIYTVFSGNYINILYQMKRFVEELGKY